RQARASPPPAARSRSGMRTGRAAWRGRCRSSSLQQPSLANSRLEVLARLAMIGAVRPHVGRRCKPIRHVVEGCDGSDVPDVAIGEADATQALAVLLFNFPRLDRELDREIEHGALAPVETRGSIVHHHHLAQNWTAELAHCVAMRGNAQRFCEETTVAII